MTYRRTTNIQINKMMCTDKVFYIRKLIISLLLTFSFSFIYSQNKPTIGTELGILELGNIKLHDQIIIYNQDGSEWMSFNYLYDSLLKAKGNTSYTLSDIKSLYNWNDTLAPYALHLDYFILMFRCTGIINGRYKVIVNEEFGLEKYIKKERFWILRDWQEHILNSVATIDVDLETNPIRVGPSDSDHILELQEAPFPISPVIIQGDWLKVRYFESDEEKYGWVKWKMGNSIIIALYYLI